jgi:hypothetical protein
MKKKNKAIVYDYAVKFFISMITGAAIGFLIVAFLHG